MKDMGSSKCVSPHFEWCTSGDALIFVSLPRRVSAVETIYASFPAFLYLNASLAGALLEPLLEFQASPTLYNKGYATPDLGVSYCPNAGLVSYTQKLCVIGSSWPSVSGNNTDQLSLAVESEFPFLAAFLTPMMREHQTAAPCLSWSLPMPRSQGKGA